MLHIIVYDVSWPLSMADRIEYDELSIDSADTNGL